jgi:hypothetical protein
MIFDVHLHQSRACMVLGSALTVDLNESRMLDEREMQQYLLWIPSSLMSGRKNSARRNLKIDQEMHLDFSAWSPGSRTRVVTSLVCQVKPKNAFMGSMIRVSKNLCIMYGHTENVSDVSNWNLRYHVRDSIGKSYVAPIPQIGFGYRRVSIPEDHDYASRR